MSQLDLAWPHRVRDGSPEPEPPLAGLHLVMPMTGSTWLGRDREGRSVTVRHLADLTDSEPVDLRDPGEQAAEDADGLARPGALVPGALVPGVLVPGVLVPGVLVSVQTPALVPVLGVQRVDKALWLVSELDHDVALDRLLRLTRPTPAQAITVGLGVVRGVRALHAAGFAHGGVSAVEVRVDGDGQVRLDGWAAGILFGSAEPLDSRQRADVAAVAVLLDDLATAARRSPLPTDEMTPALLAALDAATHRAALPGSGIEPVAEVLDAACESDLEAAARSELAALVVAVTASWSSAFSGTSRSERVPAGAPSPCLSRAMWTARLRTGLRGVWKRTRMWVAALAVLVAVVSVEFVLLHDRLTQDVRVLMGDDQPGRHAESHPGAGPAALPPVRRTAPVSAGAVLGVDLRALEPCLPEAVCAVRVLVRLQPQPEPRAVAWTFQVLDRCTGDQRDMPGGAVSVAPGDGHAQAVSMPSLPPGRALAVSAVTSEPARAASRPLVVPARGGAC